MVEREEHEKSNAIRGQRPPHLGMWPGILAETGPQMGWKRAACPRSLGTPLLAPLLAADVIDSTDVLLCLEAVP